MNKKKSIKIRKKTKRTGEINEFLMIISISVLKKKFIKTDILGEKITLQTDQQFKKKKNINNDDDDYDKKNNNSLTP